MADIQQKKLSKFFLWQNFLEKDIIRQTLRLKLISL